MCGWRAVRIAAAFCPHPQCTHAAHTSNALQTHSQPHPSHTQIVGEYMASMGDKMDVVVGHSAVDLDGRFTSVRTSETNLGNLICDLFCQACHADCVIMNSGTFRWAGRGEWGLAVRQAPCRVHWGALGCRGQGLEATHAVAAACKVIPLGTCRHGLGGAALHGVGSQRHVLCSCLQVGRDSPSWPSHLPNPHANPAHD